jgi:hydroxymethylglutaryl-CoA reductase
MGKKEKYELLLPTEAPPSGFDVSLAERGLEGFFSKLTRAQRINVIEKVVDFPVAAELDSYLHSDASLQKIFAELSENYLTNYFLPLGVVPNVLINEKLYMVPVVTEESSVVAAASRASKFWAANGGFNIEVKGTVKKGQVHFIWNGDPQYFTSIFQSIKKPLLDSTLDITEGMRSRGGGITLVDLVDKTSDIPGYFQLDVSFETADAMGANFINSCLERMADTLKKESALYENEGNLEVIMAILSNYTPESIVVCKVECPVGQLSAVSGIYSPSDFARRFVLAVQIANCDVSRAVTHNKGIYNGVDAAMLATGNDWRAIEAAGHSYSSKDGPYRSLSSAEVVDGIFRFTLTLPLAVGTVGGLTNLHPMAKLVMKILGNPSVKELMGIAATLGMATNFSAIASLITTGIQKGHMKMHLSNILNQLGASEEQITRAKEFFADKTVSYSAVEKYLKGK